MTSKAMNPEESITLCDHNRGAKAPVVEGNDSGAVPSVYCQLVSTTIPPDGGAGSTGCCAMGSTTRPPDSGAVSTGCCTMGSATNGLGSLCDIVEGNDSGAVTSVYCQLVSTTIPPDGGAGSTGCCAMGSTTRPPDSGAVSTGCCTMGSTTKRLGSSCNIVEGNDSGAVPPVYCQLVSTTIPRDGEAGSTKRKRSSSKNSYFQAPNRIINLNKLQSTVDKFLGPCPTCKGVLKLEEKYTVSFATTLEIACQICIKSQKKEKQKVRNLQLWVGTRVKIT